MPESLLRLDAVKARTGLSRSETYRRIAEGTFPLPVKLSSRRVAWVEGEILAWIDQQIARRNQSNEMESNNYV